ncbi:MAG TPA: hypothetical protein VL947_07275, partial [Cytophagales bacterium]|nr:hypothetical protein [Cytophagales bacterium]
MKNNRFSLRNLTLVTLGLMAQLLGAQTIGDGPGGVPSSNMLFWYNSSNVRSTTGVVTQWNDSKVTTNYLSPSTASTLTYNASGFT